jgi:hypothetical protein
VSTLAQLETRVLARLVDSSNAVYATATIDEALRTALSEYSAALPLASETYLTLPAAGREIALNSLSGLIAVLDVWWPYDPDSETWPPNMVSGFRVFWDDAQPVLLLASKSGNQPQAGDNLRLWYTKPHTIQNLDSGDSTTVFPNHESALVGAAAGYAAASQQLNQIGTVRIDPSEVPALQAWAAARLAEWRAFLVQLAAASPSFGPPYSEGWGIDKRDSSRSTSQSRPWRYP